MPFTIYSRIMTHGDPMKEYKHILFPKNSPNRDMFNRGILRMRETGTLNLILSEWLGKTPIDASIQSETAPVGISQAVTSLMVLLVAHVVAFVILVCEKFWAKLCTS